VIGEGELVLATGGARGITARCVVALARAYGWRFLLLGRTAIGESLPAWAATITDEAEVKRRLAAELSPARPAEIQRRYEHLRARLEIEATLRAVADAGGSAEYAAVDVAGPGVRDAIGSRVVAGIVHGAGTIADRRLEQKSGADFDRVFAPKVHGLRTLLDAVDPEALRFLALFSSAAGYYGNAGQADYAIANEILNKAAHQLSARLPGCRVVAFDWGPWGGDAGMVKPELQRLFEARGVVLVPPEAGARVVVDALAPDAAPAAQLLVGSALPPAATGDFATGSRRPQRIVRRIAEASSPFLRDHAIGGRAVLPVTCAMAWIAETCESRYPGLHAVRLDECRVLGGVALDDGEEVELTLELTESAPFRLHAEVTGRTASGRARPEYRADVVLAPERPEPPLADRPGRAVESEDGTAIYADGLLFHGPTFRGVRRILGVDADGIDLECRLPEPPREVQGRFRAGTINPYVADVLFQGLVVWGRRVHGAASLPLSTQRAELYRPLEFDRSYTVSVDVRERGQHRVLADVSATADDGRVHLRLVGAEVTVSSALDPLFAPAAAG
jgi:NAD(P)-dependent dehydrogenase (short-subunit alcohol dehydrogenase family)